LSSTTRLTHFSPIFPVRDLQRALAHYEPLGFDTKPYADGNEYGFSDSVRPASYRRRRSDGP